MMMGWIPSFGLIAAAILLLTLITKGAFLHWAASAIDWLTARPHRLMIAALIIIAAAGWWTAHGNNQRAVSWERASAAEATAHLETKARTQAAANSAQLLAEQNRAAVEAKWRDQYQDAVDELQNLRGRNAGLVTEWLRQPRPTAIAADPGGTSSANLPSLAEMPSGPVHNADTAIVPVTDLYLSAEAFAQLEALIGWIEAAQTVATSPTEPST
jgi:hypothetical protein